MRYLLLLLVACVAKPPDIRSLQMVSAEKALSIPVDARVISPLVKGLVLADEASPFIESSYAIVYAPTQCVMPVYPGVPAGEPPTQDQLPFLSCRGVGPHVGSQWVLDMYTRADPVDETNLSWVFIGWGPQAPVDYSTWGMPGCWLLAGLTTAVFIPVGINDGLLYRDQLNCGKMTLTWTPPVSAAGQEIIFQLVVARNANQFGLVTGPALKVVVGQ